MRLTKCSLIFKSDSYREIVRYNLSQARNQALPRTPFTSTSRSSSYSHAVSAIWQGADQEIWLEIRMHKRRCNRIQSGKSIRMSNHTFKNVVVAKHARAEFKSILHVCSQWVRHIWVSTHRQLTCFKSWDVSTSRLRPNGVCHQVWIASLPFFMAILDLFLAPPTILFKQKPTTATPRQCSHCSSLVRCKSHNREPLKSHSTTVHNDYHTVWRACAPISQSDNRIRRTSQSTSQHRDRIRR